MITRTVNIKGRRASTCSASSSIPNGNRKVDYIQFVCDDEWDELSCSALFSSKNSEDVYQAVLDADGVALIPHEVLADPGSFTVGLVGVSGNKRLTSTTVKIDIPRSAFNENPVNSEVVTPSIAAQLETIMRALVNEANASKTAAQEYSESAGESAESASLYEANAEIYADEAKESSESAAASATAASASASAASASAENADASAAFVASSLSSSAARADEAVAIANTAKSDAASALAGLDGKVDKLDGKELSSNDFTDAEKEKLASIEQGADVTTEASILEALGYSPASASDLTAHYTDASAHTDIRTLISGLSERLNSIADSDDVTLDQLSEIVAYIKANKSLIDSITTSKVSVSDIVDNLTTSISTKPLSAAQGVILNSLIGNKVDIVAGKGLSTNDYTDEDKNKLANINDIISVTTETIVDAGAVVGVNVGTDSSSKDESGVITIAVASDSDIDAIFALTGTDSENTLVNQLYAGITTL